MSLFGFFMGEVYLYMQPQREPPCAETRSHMTGRRPILIVKKVIKKPKHVKGYVFV